MKQRIRVSAICRKQGEILLLKRVSGRAEIAPNYELPTGRILFGEQPEEAMSRIIFDYTGAHADSIRLADAVTFTDLRNYSKLGNLFILYEVDLGETSIHITTERHSAYKWVKNTETDTVPLDEASFMVLQILGSKIDPATLSHALPDTKQVPERSVANAAIVYIDGGSRGNPGPSGVGYYIVAANGTVLKRGGEFLGFSTSRLAEYYALKEGIEQAIELGLKRARFISDNLMLVNQMNGLYRVKNPDLLQVHSDVTKLLKNFDAYSISFVSRGQNIEADAEVNKIIDAHLK
jgi:ribonuclease HI/ADP-ribose pyrophosphatase YjhB (NUDIX family)